MIKPYYKSQAASNLVEVEDFGVINLDELPIRVHKDRKGIYEICWAMTYVEGKKNMSYPNVEELAHLILEEEV